MPGDTIWHYNFGPVLGTNTFATNYTYAYNTHGYLDQVGYSVK